MNYSYEIEANINKLREEIISSSISVSIDYIELVTNTTNVVFKLALSPEEKSTLDSIISSHDNTPDSVGLQEVNIANSITTEPFSVPSYRTKKDASDSWISISDESISNIDYTLPEERYVSGGELIYTGAKEGDYIIAQVVDTLGLIPEPYRSSLAEDYPVIAAYVVKRWLIPTEPGQYRALRLDTYPLNAKLSQGLVLRVVYNPSSIVGERKFCINYELTKKL